MTLYRRVPSLDEDGRFPDRYAPPSVAQAVETVTGIAEGLPAAADAAVAAEVLAQVTPLVETATTKAEAAETARGLAVTAKNDAETARGLAQTAQVLAEDARDAAQAVPTTTDGILTALDANPASAFRVQQDARQSSTYMARNLTPTITADVDINEAVAPAGVPVSLTTYTGGVCQVETATAAGTVTADPGGSATVTVRSSFYASPSTVAVSVPLVLNDGPNGIATKTRAALAATPTVTAHFAVSGAADKIILTALVAAADDTLLNIAIAAGTATGVSAAPTSVHTTKGSLNELVHPSVLFFDEGWHGWRYWMAYTPYDLANADVENPCIAVSNDGLNWSTPAGLTNPVEPQPAGGYNADPCITMSADGRTMLLFWKQVVASNKDTCLRTSTDGVTWTTKTILFRNTFEDVSPVVLWDNGRYRMWTIKHADTPNTLYVREAAAPEGPWSAPVACTSSFPAGVEHWHIDIRRVGQQYHAIAAVGYLYFGKSDDGITWTFADAKFMTQNAAGSYKATMVPKVTERGFSYDVWYTGNTPFTLRKTTVTFDRTQRLLDASRDIAAAVNGIDPYLMGDAFNRADTTAGIGVTPGGGLTWTNVAGNDMGIASGKAYLPVAANSRAVVNLGVADYRVDVTLSVLGATSYLIFRYQDGSNLWRVGHSAGVLLLQKIVGGVLTSKTITGSIAAGGRLGVECKGSTISVYIGGILIGQWADSALSATGTYVGLNVDNTTARYDDFTARRLL